MDNIVEPSTGLILMVLVGTVLATWAFYSVYRARARVNTPSEFLLASRSKGWKMIGLAVAANWIWAPALFVAAQQGYTNGWVGVFWFTVPNVACLVLFAFFASRARRRFPDGFTLSSLARGQYSSRVQKLYLGALAGLAVCSFAVQLLAGGLVISTLTGLNFTVVTLILSGIAIAYAARLGMRATISTKVLNMGIIAAVGVTLSLATVFVAGGDVVLAGVTGIDGNMDSLVSGAGAGVFWSFGLATTIGLLSGPFGDQSFWQLAWSTRDSREVKRAFIFGAGVFALVPASMSLLGFVAAGTGIGDGGQLTNLEAILHYLPAWAVLPFLFYVLAGLISTMDTQLSSVSALTGYDLGNRFGLSEHGKVTLGRVMMGVLVTLGVLIANVPGLEVVHMFLFYGTVRAATLIPTMFAVTVDRNRLHEGAVFYGILGALVLGLPLSAAGNLGGVTPLVVVASLTVLTVSGLPTLIGYLARRNLPELGIVEDHQVSTGSATKPTGTVSG